MEILIKLRRGRLNEQDKRDIYNKIKSRHNKQKEFARIPANHKVSLFISNKNV